MPDLSFVVKNGLVVNGAFTANATVVNAAAITATSLTTSTVNATSVNTATANATTSMVVGANVTVNTTTVLVGTASVNTNITAGSILVSNATSNSSVAPGSIILDAGAFRANSTVVNAAAIFASSVNATSVNTATANATTSLVVGANVSVNTTAFFVGNTSVNATSTSGSILVLNSAGNTSIAPGSIILNGGTFRANSTVVNTAVIIATNINATSVNTATANATTSMVVGANVTVNTSTMFVGNATVNTSTTAGQISISGVTVNSTIYQGTANNATNLGGASAASYQTTAGLSANVATLTANNSLFLGTVAAASYVNSSQLSSNLSNYAALAGATFAGAVTVSNTLTVSNNMTVAGNLTVTGTTLYANVTNLDVKDINITLAKNIGSALDASGAGITVDTAGATWNYDNPTSSWQPNINLLPASNNNLNLGTAGLSWANVVANNVVGANLYGTIRTTSQPNITAGNATNLNSQPASFYTSATNLTTGTLPDARLSGTYTNMTANNALFLGGTVASAYTSATNLTSGTLPDARLSGTYTNMTANNALFLGGVVASAYTSATNLTSGTLPDARLSGTYTNITANNALFLGGLAAASYANLSAATFTGTVNVAANVTINTTAFFIGNATVNTTSTSGSILVANSTGNSSITPGLIVIGGGTFRANSTVVNTAAIIATNIHATSVNTGTANATTSMVVGANVTVNTTALSIGTTTTNTVITAGQVSISGVTVNSTIYQGTANNANNLGGLSAASYATLSGATFTGPVVVANTLFVNNDLTIAGNMTVTGTTFYANVTNVDVKDLNITVAKGVASAAAATGAGITVDVAAATWNYDNPSSSWRSNINLLPAANNTLNFGTADLRWANVHANNIVGANLYGTIQTTSQPNIIANNATNLGGLSAASYQTIGGLPANVATLTANNSTNFNSQPASFYTSATNLTTGTLPNARLSGTYSSMTANNALFLGGIAAASYANLSAATFTGTVNVGTNVLANTTAFFVNSASGNTTTTAGSILLANSTGNTSIGIGSITINGGTFRANSTVVNTASLVVGANVTVNTTAVFVGNATVNTVTTAGQISISGTTVNATNYSGTANNATNLGGLSAASYATLSGATFTGAIVGTSINATSVNTATANATTSIVVGGNVAVNTSTLFIGNSTVNSVTNSTSSSKRDGLYSTSITALSGIDISLSGTGNSRMTSGGFSVGANVNLNNTRLLVGNTSVNTNITAGQISISGVTVNSTIYQGTANNANNLNGQAASFYTDIPTRLGYTPVNRAGDTAMTGNYSTSGAIVSVGRGENEQKFLQMHNANTRVYFYLNGKEAGLYDIETSQTRWRTDTAGDLTVLNRVSAVSPQGTTGGTGYAIVEGSASGGRFGRWSWVDSGTYIEVQIDGSYVAIATTPSDISLKENIQPTTYDATKTINDIEFVSYNWKPTQYTDKDGVTQTVDKGRVECGFVAQQLQTVDPGLVKSMSDGKLMPDMLNLVSTIGLALQNAQKKIEELEIRIQNLEAN